MSVPQTESIYIEKLNNLVFNIGIPIKCWVCGDELKLGEEVAVIDVMTGPKRADMDCFERVAKGMETFFAAFDKMRVFTREIN